MTTTSQPTPADAPTLLDAAAAGAASRASGWSGVNWSGTIILILCAVTVLLPLYVTISMAFKTPGRRSTATPSRCPRPFSIVTASSTAWDLTKFPIGAGISLLVTAGTVTATILLAAFASYAIVRNWDHRLFRYSFFYLLAAMFIPFPVVALPQIQLTGRSGSTTPSA